MNEKERIEREALTYFLRLYNRQEKTKYRFLEKRERPDFLVKDKHTKEIMGVEISHIFHDKKEAMMLLGRDPSYFHGIITTNDHIEVIKRVLLKKIDRVKYYPYKGPTILVLRDYSRIFNANTIESFELDIDVPWEYIYKEMWYLSRSQPVKKWDNLIRLD